MTHQSCVSDLNEIQMSFLNGKNMINQKVVLWICGFICAQFRALFAAQGLPNHSNAPTSTSNPPKTTAQGYT